MAWVPTAAAVVVAELRRRLVRDLSKDWPRRDFGGLVVERRCHVAVDGERDGDPRLVEPLVDDPWVDALLQRQRGSG